MPFSILHFSDLHLDAAFASSRLPSQVARLCRDQLRQTLTKIVDLAKERNADAVTIAGDLFERERLIPDTTTFLYHALEQLAPIPVFIAPGNHDAADAGSIYQRGRWPENVHIAIKPTLSPWQLSKEHTLWAAAHVTPSERQNFLNGFEIIQSEAESEKGSFPILLLHASFEAPNFDSGHNHAPLRGEEIRDAGFSLALLGHYHAYQTFADDDFTAVYSGSPEPLGFHNPGEHGVLWIELETGVKPKIEFIPLAKMKFETLEISVDDCVHRDQLVEKTIASIDAKNLSDSFLHIRLVGQMDKPLHLDLEVISNRLEKHSGYIHLENVTRPAVDLNSLSGESGVRGAFVRELQALIEQEPDKKDLYEEALSYGLQAFEQEQIALR